MKVRKENLARSQEIVFGRLRLFDLYDQVRLFEHRRMVRYQGYSSLAVIGIGIACAGSRVALDEDLMAALDQLIGRRRQKRDAIFLAFDFFRDTDDHETE